MPEEEDGGQESTSEDRTAPGERLDPDRWVAKYGDAKNALGRMATQMDRVEAERDQYKRRVEEVESQLPSDDARVLSGEEQGQLKEIGILNEEGEFQPSRLREKLETAQNAQRELQTLKRRESLRQVADVEGVENFDALASLADDEEFSIGERTVDGETQQFAQVTYTEGGEEKTVPLRDYEKLKPFHDSLFATEEQEPQTRMPRQYAQPQKKQTQDDQLGADFLSRRYSPQA